MMNQLLMQMLAARGGAVNPMVADLLARMNSAGPGDCANVEELLAQQAATNPVAAMFAKQFAAQKAAREAIDQSRVIDMEAAPTPAEEEEAAAAAMEARSRELNELREKMNMMLTELELLRQRNGHARCRRGRLLPVLGTKHRLPELPRPRRTGILHPGRIPVRRVCAPGYSYAAGTKGEEPGIFAASASPNSECVMEFVSRKILKEKRKTHG